MKILNTKFNGLKTIEGIKFDDSRGYFREIFLEKWMIREGIGVAYNGQSKDEIQELHLANRERLLKEGKVKL